MFDQLKNFKGLSGLMAQMPQLREKLEKIQEELASMTVQAEAGAGAVRVTASGKLEILKVELDPAMMKVFAGEGTEQDRQIIEELITAATNEALRRAQELVRQQMLSVTGGLSLPGM